jgi:hypothetical protein
MNGTFIDAELIGEKLSELKSAFEKLMLKIIEIDPDNAAENFGSHVASTFIDYFKGLEGEPEDKQSWYEEARDTFTSELDGLDVDFD